jgi:hypothetical protein
MRFSPASRLQGSASLLIKQKSAAQGNIEETAARRCHQLGHRFPEPTQCLLPKFVIHRNSF